MKKSESEQLRKRVMQYHKFVTEGNSKMTWHHFKDEGHNRRTIYNYIKNITCEDDVKFKQIPGRPAKVATKKKINQIKKAFEKNPSLSVSSVARKLQMKRSWTQRIKVEKLSIKAITKKSSVKFTKDQEERIKKGADFIRRKWRKNVLIIDDEVYVNLDPSLGNKAQFFHSSDASKTEYDHKFKSKAKFPKKLLIWQAIDQYGNISEPFIKEGYIDTKTYQNNCLNKKLRSFIDKNHPGKRILFWPDLATIHYSYEVRNHFIQNNIDLIPKKENPPNFPQGRPIEKFWALCKNEYAKRKTIPKNITSFKRIWRNISLKIGKKNGKNLMKNLRKKLTSVATKGIKQALADGDL